MFSVVIPAYDCEHTIESALDSIVCQTRLDLIEEIIIVNDGSKDGTEEVVLQYIESHPSIDIRYLSQKNMGASKARNRGIMLAKAEWIALLDADDTWMPNKIERQSEVIYDNEQICFMGSSYPVKLFFKTYKSGLIKLTPKQLCIRYTPSTPSVVFKKEDGIDLGLFNESMRYAEDINFYQKFFLKNSYFVLAEDLVRISIGKKYFNETGLSSDLKQMKMGREINLKELQRLGLISTQYLLCMYLFSNIKYLRRVALRFVAERLSN